MSREHIGTAQFFGKARVGNTLVPAGDGGEQIIANLSLSILACHLGDVATAKQNLVQAHAIAIRIAGHTQKYCPPGAIKIVRLMYEAEKQYGTIIVPVVGDSLVMPVIGHQEAASRFKQNASGQVGVGLNAMKLAYFKLSLRPTRVASELKSSLKAGTLEQLESAAESILGRCLDREIFSVEPADRANDCLSLARSAIRLGGVPVALLILKEAERILKEYSQAIGAAYEREWAMSIKEKVALLIEQLTNSGV